MTTARVGQGREVSMVTQVIVIYPSHSRVKEETMNILKSYEHRDADPPAYPGICHMDPS